MAIGMSLGAFSGSHTYKWLRHLSARIKEAAHNLPKNYDYHGQAMFCCLRPTAGGERRRMGILEKVGFGHRNATKRSADPFKDRAERKEIEEANNNGDCIINVGNGYYRPIPNDPVDDKEFNEYMAKDLSRARKILRKRMKMKIVYERWRECGTSFNNTGTSGRAE